MDQKTHPWNVAYDGFAIPQSWNIHGEDREYLEQETWSLVLHGRDELEEYVDLFEEELEEAGIGEDEALAFFEHVLEKRREQQREFGAKPASALSDAFAELAEIGVVAREDFTCCGTCGSSEIALERDESRTWRGYVYYHEQDTDRLIERRETYIGYGVFLEAHLPESEWDALNEAQRQSLYSDLTVRLMRDEVVPVLKKHGVEVEWNGDLSTRILLQNVDFFAEV